MNGNINWLQTKRKENDLPNFTTHVQVCEEFQALLILPNFLPTPAFISSDKALTAFCNEAASSSARQMREVSITKDSLFVPSASSYFRSKAPHCCSRATRRSRIIFSSETDEAPLCGLLNAKGGTATGLRGESCHKTTSELKRTESNHIFNSQYIRSYLKYVVEFS